MNDDAIFNAPTNLTDTPIQVTPDIIEELRSYCLEGVSNCEYHIVSGEDVKYFKNIWRKCKLTLLVLDEFEKKVMNN